jgi:beta-N-acetylhexosaminidase
MTLALPLGPIMLGVAGLELAEDDCVRLAHPMVGGVILFTRNYASPGQLKALTRAIKAPRSPELLIAVDHEGGRVQRFRDGFTAIPPMRELGNLWDSDRHDATSVAHSVGYVIARELAAHGVDFSFAPVLDIDHGNSSVIGNRAFHNHAKAVAALACALQAGMRAGGMTTVGKHYPGHGYARADSHVAVPIDERALAEIEASDLVPFMRMTEEGMGAVMPAHVVYPKIDDRPAGFSPIWLKEILRGRMGFAGAIISDDLGMEGASTAGGLVERARAALAAGCDLIISSNDFAAADKLLAELDFTESEGSQATLENLRARQHAAFPDDAYLAAREEVVRFAQSVVPPQKPPAPNDIVARL